MEVPSVKLDKHLFVSYTTLLYSNAAILHHPLALWKFTTHSLPPPLSTSSSYNQH